MHSISWNIEAGMIVSAVENIWVSGALCYYIRKQKSGFKRRELWQNILYLLRLIYPILRTNAVIHTLTIYIVGTGLLTGICVLFIVITVCMFFWWQQLPESWRMWQFKALNTTFVYLAFYLSYPKRACTAILSLGSVYINYTSSTLQHASYDPQRTWEVH